ncbi:MAG: carbohydrate ABC transporter permease [Firmicutes bacterium]|nr:carbohydrate ABC transporter permease [Bacillota bacterium]
MDRHQALAVGRDVLLYVILGILGLMFALPFIWMISTSLKTAVDVFMFPPKWIPDPIMWVNYKELFRVLPFFRFFKNSAYISFLCTFGQIASCALAAYAFSRPKFFGRDFLFFVLLATMMVPGQVTIIPRFLIMRAIGWMDTHLPLIIPSFLGGAFGTFMLRQFFMGIPKELEDAAAIDGCSRFRTFLVIYLPLSKPAIATLALFVFMDAWNDLLNPIIYLSTPSKMTLTVGLTLFQGEYRTDWHLLMAGAVVSIVPTVVVYLATQKHFESGIMMGSIKG